MISEFDLTQEDIKEQVKQRGNN